MAYFYKNLCQRISAANLPALEAAIDVWLIANGVTLRRKWINQAGTEALLFYHTVLDASLVNPLLVFTFDNVEIGQFNLAYPLFLAKGCAGTFYCNLNEIGTVGCMTWANIVAMAGGGMDMQDHSQTHTDFTTLTPAQMLLECAAVDAAFIAAGLAAPTHFSYPWGAYNNTVIQTLSTVRQTCRTYTNWTTSYIHAERSTFRYELQSYRIDDVLSFNVNDFINYHMEACRISKGIMVTLSHAVNVLGGGATKISDIETIIDYAQAHGFVIVTIAGLRTNWLI